MDKYIVLPDVGLQDVNPVEYGDEVCTSEKGRTRTVREYYLLHYICSGSGRYTVGDQTFAVHAGEVFIVHPYDVVYYEPDQDNPWHYFWVGFHTTMDLPLLKSRYVMDARHAEHIFRAIGATDPNARGCEVYIAGKVLEYLSTLAHVDSIGGHATFVDDAVAYIDRNYARPITIDALAEQLHVSHSYFTTAFRRRTGVAPHQYLMDLRLKRAAELLTGQGCSVTEAALSVGYNNIYNFSKMFKRKYGVSPSRYAAPPEREEES